MGHLSKANRSKQFDAKVYHIAASRKKKRLIRCIFLKKRLINTPEVKALYKDEGYLSFTDISILVNNTAFQMSLCKQTLPKYYDRLIHLIRTDPMSKFIVRKCGYDWYSLAELRECTSALLISKWKLEKFNIISSDMFIGLTS